MNTPVPQHNTDIGRQCEKRASPGVTLRATATPQQLDTAILAALSEAGGEVVAWSVLREKLPRAPYWMKIRALVRLHERGELAAFKVAGRTYVDPIVLAVT